MKHFYPIIQKLGGAKEVYRKLKVLGYPARTPRALDMWSNPKRARIPGTAMRLLMTIATLEGVEYTPKDFELKTKPPQF